MQVGKSLAGAECALLLVLFAQPVAAGDFLGGGSMSMGNFGSGNFSSSSLNSTISGMVSNAMSSVPAAYGGAGQADFSGLANSGSYGGSGSFGGGSDSGHGGGYGSGYGGASAGQTDTRGGTAFSFGSGNGNGNGNVGNGNGNGNSGNGNGNGNIGNYNGNNSSGNYNGNRNRGDGNGNNKKTDNNDNDRNWHSHPRKIDIHDNNGKGGNRNGVRAEAAFDRVVVRDAIQQNGILENTQQNNPQNIQEQACRRMGLCQPELRPEDLER